MLHGGVELCHYIVNGVYGIIEADRSRSPEYSGFLQYIKVKPLFLLFLAFYIPFVVCSKCQIWLVTNTL